MNHSFIVDRLEENRNVFQGLFSGVPEGQRHWKPAEKKWSTLEVLCHLYDEERDDFRARIRHILSGTEGPLPGIDPEGWVSARKYSQKDWDEVLGLFLEERSASISWLRGLENPDWTLAYQHPKFGPMSAEMLLACWLGHDLLHFRQLSTLQWGYLTEQADPVSLIYAGRW